jgi:hypothetical protein
MKIQALLLPALFVLVGCGTGPCRGQKTETSTAAATSMAANPELPMNQQKPNARVRVSKPDGSLQCGQGSATPLAKMQEELKDLPVYSSENKADGLMHIQVCGSPTGRHNVYEIDRTDLEKARALGFKEWTW